MTKLLPYLCANDNPVITIEICSVISSPSTFSQKKVEGFLLVGFFNDELVGFFASCFEGTMRVQ
mgnify:CR=1 FL=1